MTRHPPKFKWFTWPNHAPFRDGLPSVDKHLLRSTYTPNLKSLPLLTTMQSMMQQKQAGKRELDINECCWKGNVHVSRHYRCHIYMGGARGAPGQMTLLKSSHPSCRPDWASEQTQDAGLYYTILFAKSTHWMTTGVPFTRSDLQSGRPDTAAAHLIACLQMRAKWRRCQLLVILWNSTEFHGNVEILRLRSKFCAPRKSVGPTASRWFHLLQ